MLNAIEKTAFSFILAFGMLLALSASRSTASELQPIERDAVAQCQADLDNLHAEWNEIFPPGDEFGEHAAWTSRRDQVCGSDPRADGEMFQSLVGQIPLIASTPLCEGCSFSTNIYCVPAKYHGSLAGLTIKITEWSVGTAASTSHRYVAHEDIMTRTVTAAGGVPHISSQGDPALAYSADCIAAFVSGT
jgi:hypothetical protein